MGKLITSLFGGGGGQQGPSESEKAMQAERYQAANRADAEADQSVALAARARSLRNALSFRDDRRKGTLGG